MRDATWAAGKAELQAAMSGLVFAIGAETRCGDKNGLVDGWNEELDRLIGFYSSVSTEERESAQGRYEELNGYSKRRVTPRLKYWLKTGR